jgi:hypothetical protein
MPHNSDKKISRFLNPFQFSAKNTAQGTQTRLENGIQDFTALLLRKTVQLFFAAEHQTTNIAAQGSMSPHRQSTPMPNLPSWKWRQRWRIQMTMIHPHL